MSDLERLTGALIAHDADPPHPALRRPAPVVLTGVLIAALTAGVLAAYGMVTGAALAEPTDPTAILLDRHSGARYVYLESDRRLHPILNYTSGLLLAAAESPRVKAVSTRKLAGVPLGGTLGIPDAPDDLPLAGKLLDGAWTVCTAGGAGTVLVGTTPTGGTVAEQALLVRDPTGRTFLVHAGHRFQLPADRVDATLRALGWYGRTPGPVATGWIDAVPAGPDLIAPEVPAAGTASALPGRWVGEVLTDSAGQFAVVLGDGIAAVTELQARLLGPPIAVGAAFRGLRPSDRGVRSAAGLPAVVPPIAEFPVRACVTRPADGPATVRLNPAVPDAGPVHVPRGHGAVVTSPAGPVQVVTDTGRAYPLASGDLLTRLGYPGVRPVTVPAELLAQLPAGPLLDRERAGRR
ncbi:type VII secretion protein EccB [Actinoplanes octamycinicus]|uniref:Type VII secretion protein EccB n=1 Tax=Actinoplanes octamycinicus TaxID=135948 RepID=A0A7W7GTG4_9ACTN|nr:type VII secretion protein EccB [Actinoplanes octamycinicus]MBB4738010.1 type VII secretion protein EccB [Actinoplanes octamycinicus]GIE58940.1 type VII secretion protein EccB [Actinoplanes octamycinicus]